MLGPGCGFEILRGEGQLTLMMLAVALGFGCWWWFWDLERETEARTALSVSARAVCQTSGKGSLQSAELQKACPQSSENQGKEGSVD